MALCQSLVISERTVHAHVRNVLEKLDPQGRVEIASWLIPPG